MGVLGAPESLDYVYMCSATVELGFESYPELGPLDRLSLGGCEVELWETVRMDCWNSYRTDRWVVRLMKVDARGVAGGRTDVDQQSDRSSVRTRPMRLFHKL